MSTRMPAGVLLALPAAWWLACARVAPSAGATGGTAGGTDSGAPTTNVVTDGGRSGAGGTGTSVDAGPPQPPGDPTTCAQAAADRTYIGCDYWPTVVANNVWSIFDYAVVVANGQQRPAMVTVTGPNGVNQTDTRSPPGSSTKSTCRGSPRSRAPTPTRAAARSP